MILAAHRSRHYLLTEFLDPSILDEATPERREPALNIYDRANPNQPPYSDDFVVAYRAAQVARNRRITAYAKDKLDELRRTGREDQEHCFVVQGTMADPRWVDPTVDPNDRGPGSYLGDPRLVNDGPSGLGRYTTTRSWLSQWSLDDAQVDGVEGAKRVSVPVLILENSADDACPPEHPRAIFAAVPHGDKEFIVVDGANHYYSGQREHMDAALGHVARWAGEHAAD
jgi:fermentation-respiration switch protein FrsA (DUF1100 family)